jgi:hypothetical protein
LDPPSQPAYEEIAMTTVAPSTQPIPSRTANPPVPRPYRSLALRRAFLVSAPVVAGLFLIVGAVADPSGGISGTRMHEIYTAHPEALQFKSLGYKWAYAFWIAPALLAVPYIRARGSAIATLAGFVGFGGLTTMPGLLASDWFESAIGQLYGVEAIERVFGHMEDTMWGLPVFMMPGTIGLFLGLPLIMVAFWRAGAARWWGFAASVAAMVAFMVSEATVWGASLALVFLTVVAVALGRATRGQAV